MSFAGELDWWEAGTVPAPASIVWCNFPEHLTPDVAGPKARPALVFKVRYATKVPDGRFLVQVAYGTTKLKTGKRPYDFYVGNSATLDILRLPAATRFDLDTMLWLPWSREFFAPRHGGRNSTPTVSVLPGSVQEQLRWTMAKRQADGRDAAYRTPAPTVPE